MALRLSEGLGLRGAILTPLGIRLPEVSPWSPMFSIVVVGESDLRERVAEEAFVVVRKEKFYLIARLKLGGKTCT